ncbi:hypothetical protein BV25DRAFT_1718400 [Artomyces pyxidatus]|uniref:Uncharacterized protein n=1 Tax=Artomyces pyxidatus TaxID=48021 RepID=A0ACB8SHM0_9AGAM|nr:hypothetical protein BV25DRAFT_1718400 [Artomyces pyxidatus]
METHMSENGSEREGDLPIMDLPDTADDVRDFLKAMYFPSETNRHQTLSSPYRESDGYWALFPDSYCGILRLATKYDASPIRNIIVGALEREWPTDLYQWVPLQGHIQEEIANYGLAMGEDDSTPYWPNPVRAIRLASDYAAPRVLPIAYYDLMRVLNEGYDPDVSVPKRDRDTSALTADDLRRVIRGRAALHAALFKGLIDIPARSASCKAGDACTSGVQAYMESCAADMRQLEHDPIYWLEVMIPRWDTATAPASRTHACGTCCFHMRGHLGRLRRKLWVALPEYFDVADVVPSGWGE